jgi:hypothetical protein
MDREWLCSLSNQPQLPLGLDNVAEASHEVLPLAILLAFLQARRAAAKSSSSSTAGAASESDIGLRGVLRQLHLNCEMKHAWFGIRRRICGRTIMMKPRQTIPQQLNSSQVMFRFVCRLVLLSTFATFGTQGFKTGFAGLVALSGIFCAVTWAMRREAIFGPVLTHWDEAVAYAVIGRLVSAIA